MKIKCTHPNASDFISGVSFAKDKDGFMVSVDDVTDEQAKYFLSIPDYYDANPPTEEQVAAAKKAASKAARDEADRLAKVEADSLAAEKAEADRLAAEQLKNGKK